MGKQAEKSIEGAEMRTKHREQRGKDNFVVELSRINVDEEFNKRGENSYGDIKGLADSIETVGQKTPGIAYLKDGEWHLTAGHRRLTALHLIAERTGKEQTMVLMKGSSDPVERLIEQYVENVKEPTSDWDRAQIIKGLSDSGLTGKEIQTRLSLAASTVAYLKSICEMPEPLQQAVKNEEMSGSTAVKMNRSLKGKKEELVETLEKGRAAAKADGKKKISDKHVDTKGSRTPQTIMKLCVGRLEAKAEKGDKLSKNETFALELFRKVLDKCADRTLSDLIRNGTK